MSLREAHFSVYSEVNPDVTAWFRSNTVVPLVSSKPTRDVNTGIG
jgi:hypothetical protein